jgi:hypothetical protein
MKNQYFGDRNDMFKYDLALTLVAEVAAPQAFTFVPMLTPDDAGTDGNLTDYSALGKHRPILHDFLVGCVGDPLRRKVTSLQDYMQTSERQVPYHPHMDAEYLNDANRPTYFSSISLEALEASVILVDPDNGFEVSEKTMKRTGVHKYFRYSEFADLYRRMDDASVLLAYQHWAHVKRDQAFAAVAERISSVVPEASPPICISSGSIGFFAVAKNADLPARLREVIDEYAARTGFTVYPYQD